MSRPDYTEDEPGKKVIMLGNEALARGILEAGVIVGAGYYERFLSIFKIRMEYQ
jgi:TPP-dependent indolepyruvate ferredoxin oxidoreductase alpha subunit